MSLRNKLQTFCSKLTESSQRRSLQAPSSRARNACRRRARRVRRAPARRPGPDARSRHTHKHPSLPRSSSTDLRWSLFTSPFSVWHSLVRLNARYSSPSGKVLSALQDMSATTQSLFPRLVLGWVNADFRVQICIFQHFSSSTRKSSSRKQICKNVCKFSLNFTKSWENF